ncbi:MraY family glycosyltransferase [Wenyingzhuangia marina]|uniref:UDP-N-acetylmuramyl pentapeptide phosphotransferase/UDP-N-acetylglucosamine-1-phosphate transferase n=1 Tax=Wenyingzhuangia marina TaxID=1195760 RepID=A0A1M5WD22_9FLAO|nr:glycosyltransferase family 4 protein [Wenyingzhuangia marina]GGF81773.1 UDP-GlcNAc--UDP-phosphate GlcNAc-1-phosphate transferase [Wenyingzhuangia marina]SHH85406.1 UDP-N-acetylmuramyl pentapeptide phosphotransferase/UDP-N-acetylglucosamine-1-phosphate transferase [Wenyingzhuangia marina]
MYIITFLILSLVSIVYLKLADKLNIIDKPNQRSSHTVPTIRGGGILFVVAFFLYQITTGFTDTYLSIAVLLIATVSFIDDMVTLSAKIRFPFQMVTVTLVIYQIGLFNLPIWIPLITIFLGTAFINFFNFMDGINGITGLYSIAVLIGIYIVNFNNPIISNKLIVYELLALVVFGCYNFRKKARFFAGDIGSISMALILAYMLITLFYKFESPIYILLFVVYGADATITVFYRAMIKENITEAHRHHIYQKLVDRTLLTHLQVAALYSVLQLIMVAFVWLILPYPIEIHYIFTGIVMLFMMILYVFIYTKMEKKS